jgi:hypothetical protein
MLASVWELTSASGIDRLGETGSRLAPDECSS